MRMARVNVYLPDELAREARAAGLNISRVTQEALASTLEHDETDRWLEHLQGLPRTEVSHQRVIKAIDEGRAELGHRARA
jgi:post-segregation antitoxin (ccd killing protein)